MYSSLMIHFATWYLVAWYFTWAVGLRTSPYLYYKSLLTSIKVAVLEVSVANSVTLSPNLVSFQTLLTTLFQKTTSAKCSNLFWWYWRLLETLTWKHILFLLFSASSMCCCGPLPIPKPHRRPSPCTTAPPSCSQSRKCSTLRVQTANESRVQKAAAGWSQLIVKAGCKCNIFFV